VSLNRRLQNKKIDENSAKVAFNQLDNKRKGYLDLANIYSLCSNVSEDELFHVFKWLDLSKNGDIYPQDFIRAVTSKSASNENSNNPVENVKSLIATYL
jgi:Ca2+-binding EF-hand superfamily protein